MSPDELSELSESRPNCQTANTQEQSNLAATEFQVGSSGTNQDFFAEPVNVGGTIGRYTLLEKLGEGGFGSVWSAMQLHPVQREVAIKVLKSGMESLEVVKRFALEKQALAMMDHRGIARVYDAGMTESGLPYFVMELVKGQPLNQFCDSNKLNVNQRLQLFIQVCEAVHHAHRRGVIHRDLKPSNILVCQSDGGNLAKVIDFGIAKATTSVADLTLHTQLGQFMGTPAYMSPEQADGLANQIDVRSDVYSLGVILYELLVGTRPFESLSNQRLSVDEIRRRVRSEIPVRPSARVKQLDPQKLLERKQSTSMELDEIFTAIRGDLDWITMKALEKEPERRYESANDFASDIRRHLVQEPVSAHPPSRWYVAQRFVSRHRWAVATTVIVASMLISASLVSTAMYFKEQRARTQADRESNRAKQMVRILSQMISAAGPSVSQGRDTGLLKDILAETAKRIEDELRDQPEIELEIRRLLAKAYTDIGEFQLSYKLYSRVAELEQLLHADDNARIANAYAELSESLDSLDRLEDAEMYLRMAIKLREELRPMPTAQISRDRELLAWLLSRRGDFVASEHEVRRALRDFPTDDAKEQVFRGHAMMTLGLALLKTAQFRESEVANRDALDIFRALHNNPHPEMVIAINNLCHILVEVGKFDEVELLAREGLSMQEVLDGSPIGACTDSLNKALASVYAHRGDFDRAVECLQFAIQAATKVYGSDHRFTNDKRSLLAQIQVHAGRLDDANKTLEEALELGGSGQSADNSLAIAHAKLAFARGEFGEVEKIALAEYNRTKSESKNPSTGQLDATLLLIDVNLQRNDFVAASNLLREALDILKPEKNEQSILLQDFRQRESKLSSKTN